MRDRGAVVLATATAIGAVAARGPSPLIGGLLVAIALVARRPWLLCLGAALLASGLAARSWAGLDGARAGAFEGVVTLATDPRDDGGATVADVRADGRRYEARVTGGAARAAVRDRLAGERLRVRGRVHPHPGGRVPPWWAARHVSGRLSVDAVEPAGPAPAVVRLANGLRRTLAHGAAHLPTTARSLFAGFVVGDDREQPVLVADDFRAAGLSHLLAVSGQNVAFVLALAAPGLHRLALPSRLGATLAVLGFFALVTRIEPSVLRASAMAATRAVADTAGRPAGGLRLLALAVTVLVLVDPLLVHAVGFQLSVAASLGIVVLSPRIEQRLPGPRWLAAPLAVSVAAQAGVAPVLVPHFGGVPVAALPANLLAAPAAGPVMVWGMTGGVIAGVAGGGVARLLHLPTQALLWWVALVARSLGRLPLGELGAVPLIVLTAVALAWAHARRCRPLRVAAGIALVAVLLAPAAALRHGPQPGPLGPGAGLDRSNGAVVVTVDGRARPAPLLEALRRRGVRRIDVLVIRTPSEAAARVAALLTERWPTGRVVGPSAPNIRGAGRVGSGCCSSSAPVTATTSPPGPW